MVGDGAAYLQENMTVTLQMFNGEAVSITLPASIPAGSVGVLWLSNNSSGDTVSTPTNNSVSWTPRGSGSPGTTLITYLFSKDLGTADSGTNITATWNGRSQALRAGGGVQIEPAVRVATSSRP